MSNSTFNTFSELNTDSHPLNAKPDTMVDAINAALTTDGANQLILQNMKGTDLFSSLTKDYRPLGVAVHENIAYILSGKFHDDGTFISGEIGTFPSPDWTAINNSQDPEEYFPLVQAYAPLHNFYSGTSTAALNNDSSHKAPFRTSKLDFQADRLIEIELQPSYDESINIIFTDDYNPVRLVNSRFKLHEDGKRAAIANRRQKKDTNTYSNLEFDSTKLIKSSNVIPKLTFDGVFPGGAHTGGGRRFYFRYIDSDGTLTDIIEESRLVVFAYDDHGTSSENNTGKLVKFTLENLDTKFSGIKVYYSLGENLVTPSTLVYEIRDIYDIISTKKVITIYGNEDVDLYDADRLNLTYSAIGTVKTMTQYDDRLLLGNVTTTIDDYEYFRKLAYKLQVKEREEELVIKGLGKGYANPDNVYSHLGYWAGETYELGIVFILNDGTLTPVLPLRGGDNYDGTFTYTTNNNFGDDGFITNSSENRLGIYRTKAKRTMLRNATGDSTEFVADRTDIKYFDIDITSLKADATVQSETKGFFFTRKERKRDCVVQGFTTNTTRVPVNQKISETGRYNANSATSNWDNEQNIHIQDLDGHLGKHDNDLNHQFKIIPAPGRIGEVTRDSTDDTTQHDPISKQGWVSPSQDWGYANTGQAEFNNEKPELYWAFYAADQLADPAIMATTFNGGEKGIMTNNIANVIKANSIVDSTATLNVSQNIASASFSTLDLGTLAVTDGKGKFADSTFITLMSSSSNIQTIKIVTTFAFDPGGGQGNKFYTISFNLLVNNSNQIVGSFNFKDGSDDGWSLNVTPTITGTFPFIETTDVAGVLSPQASINFGVGGLWVKKNNKVKSIDPFTSDFNVTLASNPVLSTNPTVTSNEANPIKVLNLNPFYSNLEDPKLLLNDNKYNFNYISYNQDAFTSRQFSAIEDRNIYYAAAENWSSNLSAPDWSVNNYVVSTGAGIASDLFSSNTQYSEYIGFTSKEGDNAFTVPLANDNFNVNNFRVEGFDTAYFTGNGLNDYVKQVQFDGFNLAVLTNVYDSPSGVLTQTNWKNKYSSLSSQEAYHAVTKRYSWDEVSSTNNIDLFSGDCYIAHVYKQIMLGLGIPGVDSATDPAGYTDGNQSTGLSPKGFVMPIVTENNYNVNLRIEDDSIDTEVTLYGKGRTFYPLDNIDSIRSSRQKESTAYNFGYNDNIHDKFYVGLNDRSPVFNLDYGNRVYVSEVSVSGSFNNGYLDFSGLNFKDYNRQFGQITKLITHNNNVYCIFEQGVGVLPINQKTMLSQQDGGVFIDNAEVLAPKMQVISTEYGSDQQFSIIKTDQAIYGCDLRKNRIWRIAGVNGQYGLEIISDFAIQSLLKEYKKRINNSPARNYVKANYDRERNDVVFSYMNLENGKYTTNLLGVCPGATVTRDTTVNETETTNPDLYSPALGPALNYINNKAQVTNNNLEAEEFGANQFISAPEFKEGTNSFQINKSKTKEENLYIGTYESICKENKIASVYFNETLNKWISKLSWNPLWMFNIENNLYSFNATANRENIWKHFSDNVPYLHIYGNQEKFIFEFVLVDKSAVQKVINNLMVISNRAFPGRVSYTLLENDFDYDNFTSNNNDHIQKLKQRQELEPSVGWNITTSTLSGNAVINITGMSEEETERLVGGYVVFAGTIYIIGAAVKGPTGIFYNEILDQNGNNITGTLPAGFTFNTIDFGIIKQNMEYIEDHLYIEVGKNDKGVDIRDKAIKIKFTYEGYDYVTIQAILSSFVYSFN